MRVVLMVLDSVGIGELPDAHAYGDEGSNTVLNIFRQRKKLEIPNLKKFGFANIEGLEELGHEGEPQGSFGKLQEVSKGKDTTTGHWEIAGVVTSNPFPTYPNGFPTSIINEFINKSQVEGILGNVVASGTEIIDKLGDEHVKTGYPIVYTSADSVFQIAAHEDIIPIEKLYEMCRRAREILVGDTGVGRVIARPFIGESGNYQRTDKRRDFSLEPTGQTTLDVLTNNKYRVCAVGKIEDIYAKRGISDAVHTHDNNDGVNKTLDYMKEDFEGIIFTNLVDFDMKYGHRNDVEGYGKALEDFDLRLPEIISSLKDDDILMITADHGCDPTTPSTDHSREYIPLVIIGKSIKKGVNVGVRKSFSDISATILEMFNLPKLENGESFYSLIK